jgi:ADP-heptose:LPS heptosyltransferase
MVQALARNGTTVDVILHQSLRGLPLPSAVHRVHYLPLPGSSDWTEHIETLRKFLDPLKEEGYDRLLNLSHDATSSLVASYLRARETVGTEYLRDRATGLRHEWMHYLWSSMAERRLGVFNLADVYAQLAGVRLVPRAPSLTPSSAAVEKARRLLAAKGCLARPRVGLVPGASDERKRWPVERFAGVGRTLRDQNLSVLVLGAPEERPLAERLCAIARGLPHAVGETDLEGLLALVSQLDLVVTNDTGTLHAAAAVGVRTLVVTCGPAFFHESGPYGEGHLVIQPELDCSPCDFASYCGEPVCHDSVGPQDVSHLARGMVLPAASKLPYDLVARSRSYRVFRSVFSSDRRLAFQPAAPYVLGAFDLARAVYGELWSVSLGLREAPRPATGVLRELAERWNLERIDAALEGLETAARDADEILSVENEACRRLLAARRNAAPCPPGLIEHLVERVELVGRKSPLLRPLSAFTVSQAQFAGSRSKRTALMELLTAFASGIDRARLFQAMVGELVVAVGASPVEPRLQMRPDLAAP